MRIPDKLRRRLGGVLLLGVGLVITGGLYSVFVPEPQAAGAQVDREKLATGAKLYNTSCISCHGANLQGVKDRGPGLIGVGSAAVYFQVSTGRMPAARESPHERRRAPAPEFDPKTERGRHNLEALQYYVQAHGGGPRLPEQSREEYIGEDVARGGKLFRLNCASCHNFTGRGGALVRGKFAPQLGEASPKQIYAAMLTGPSAMPVFGDRQLTPRQKEDIAAYLLSVRDGRNTPGGFNLGEVGPSAEGVVAFGVGMVALVLISMWIGSKS